MTGSQSSPNLDIRVLVGGLLALMLLTGLGVWQLNRAEEKRLLLERKGRITPPIHFLDQARLQHLSSVSLQGQFLTTAQFLLDNRIYQGQPGYEVLVLLQQDMDHRAILVNLGWLAAGNDRRQLPEFSIPAGRQTVNGRLTTVTPGLMLAHDRWDNGWPKRIQQIDINRIEQLLGIELYPWQVRLDKPLIDGLVVEWKAVNMSPEKHRAYAVQWFTMAAALFLWLIWFLKPRPTNEVKR